MRTALVLIGLLLLGGAGVMLATRGGGPEDTTEARSLAEEAVPAPAPSPGRVLAPEPEEEPPRDPAARWNEINNLAHDFLEEGQLVRAVELFEECHGAIPSSDVYRRNLAEALSRLAQRTHDEEEDLEGGIAHLRRATEVAPERDDLVRLLERWETELRLSGDDTVHQGTIFVLAYDGERKDLLHQFQEVLDFLEGGPGHGEGAFAELRDWFGVDPWSHGQKIRVVLYDRAEFDQLTGLGDWAGGVFDGTIRVAVNDLHSERARWGRVLRHELAHAFVREVGGRDVPGWLNEGLAQMLETDVPRVSAARAQLVGATLFPLETLHDSLATWSDTEAIGRAYAQSLVFCEHIARQYGDEELRQMLLGCKDGRGAAAAFRARNPASPLEVVLRDLQDDLMR